MYTVKISKQIQKFLSSHPHLRKSLVERIEFLKYNPRDWRLGIKALEWFTDYFRIKIGKYRVVYSVNDELIEVLLIKMGNRDDIYKNLL